MMEPNCPAPADASRSLANAMSIFVYYNCYNCHHDYKFMVLTNDDLESMSVHDVQTC